MSSERKEIDSEDEAPEDMSLSEAKNEAQERSRNVQDSIHRQKTATKEYRRERQKRLKEQKLVKSKKSLVRLPDEILNVLSEVDSTKTDSITGKEAKETSGLGLDQETTTTPILPLSRSKRGSQKRRELKAGSAKKPKNEVFDGDLCDESKDSLAIHGNSVSNVFPGAITVKQKLSSVESKANIGRKFLKEQLYGDRIKRVAASSFRNLQTKKHVRPSAKF